MSSGLYGVAVFSVNLRKHDHIAPSLFSLYVNFYAPFLMFFGMAAIPVIHYWRNNKLKACVNKDIMAIKDRIMGRGSISNTFKKMSTSRVSQISFSMWPTVIRPTNIENED